MVQAWVINVFMENVFEDWMVCYRFYTCVA